MSEDVVDPLPTTPNSTGIAHAFSPPVVTDGTNPTNDVEAPPVVLNETAEAAVTLLNIAAPTTLAPSLKVESYTAPYSMYKRLAWLTFVIFVFKHPTYTPVFTDAAPDVMRTAVLFSHRALPK